MTRIESPAVPLNASCDRVSKDFLDWTSFGELLSTGPVSDFQGEGDRCSFKVSGGVAVHLVRTSSLEATEGRVLELVTEAPTPVKFTIDVTLTPQETGCTCLVGCDAELNPFTKMMVEPALTGLFGQMAATLKGRY